MKKVLLTLISIILVISSANVFADEEIEGLNENLDELLMMNHFTKDEIEEINKKYIEERTDYLRNDYIPKSLFLNKMREENVEQEFEVLMDEFTLIYEEGIKISGFSNYEYSYQYVQADCFDYLFSGKELWSVPSKRRPTGIDSAKFELSGERIERFDEFLGNSYMTGGHNKAVYLVKEKSTIKKLLTEQNVKKVEDIKFCVYRGYITGIYFKCDNSKEFFLLVDARYWEISKREADEYFEFLTLGEISTIVEEERFKERARIIGEEISKIKEDFPIPEKLTFEAEALSLQEDGLLHGNEKGLDLLKPLTRVEAATMLLRAMGKETAAAVGQTQTFSDVLSSHWGFGAVENAYSLGLIKGMGENIFAPDEPVTAVQFATMVLRAGNEAEFNWEEAIDILIEKGVITEENSKTMDFFTRGDMAKIIYEARNNGLF